MGTAWLKVHVMPSFVTEVALPDGPGAEGAVSVTGAVADFELSAMLVAVTEKEPVVAPAVKNPEEETAPPVAVQFTPVLDVPVTLAVNCWVSPVCTDAEVGDTATDTLVPEGGVFETVPGEPPAPMQPLRFSTRPATRVKSRRKE
jgi:hypothetical protein